jgi:hypothetical protein
MRPQKAPSVNTTMSVRHADVGGYVKLAVSVREAAAMLSVSPRSVQNYIRLKILLARKIGRRTVIPVSALKAFLSKDRALPLAEREAQ